MEYAFDVIPGTAIYPLVMEHIPQIVERVHMAIAAYVMQCDYVLPYLVQMA